MSFKLIVLKTWCTSLGVKKSLVLVNRDILFLNHRAAFRSTIDKTEISVICWFAVNYSRTRIRFSPSRIYIHICIHEYFCFHFFICFKLLLIPGNTAIFIKILPCTFQWRAVLYLINDCLYIRIACPGYKKANHTKN